MTRVRLTNNSLNSYGTRVLTQGIDTSRYEANPILLYMHERGTVIGVVTNIEKTDDEITGELQFDEATELSRQCKQQFEFGSLRMVSVGLDVVEVSDAPDVILPGQAFYTVTKSILFEVSLVDIGANPDAIRLRYKGKMLNLSDGGANPLPALKPINMDKPQIEVAKSAAALGLDEGATCEQCFEKIATMKADGEAASQKIAELTAEVGTVNAQLKTSNAKMFEAAIDKAIGEGRIDAGRKEHFMKLAAEVGYEMLCSTLESCQPRVTLASQMLGGEKTEDAAKEYDRRDREGSLLSLKRENPAEFQRLYEAKFGRKA